MFCFQSAFIGVCNFENLWGQPKKCLNFRTGFGGGYDTLNWHRWNQNFKAAVFYVMSLCQVIAILIWNCFDRMRKHVGHQRPVNNKMMWELFTLCCREFLHLHLHGRCNQQRFEPFQNLISLLLNIYTDTHMHTHVCISVHNSTVLTLIPLSNCFYT